MTDLNAVLPGARSKLAKLGRRRFVTGGAAMLAVHAAPARSEEIAGEVATQPLGPLPTGTPDIVLTEAHLQSRRAFVAFLSQARGENPDFLGQRWDLVQTLVQSGHLWNRADIEACLLTPREEFIPEARRDRTYKPVPIDIGQGGVISDPLVIARMNSELNLKPGERVLEIGTGSGYQAAYLSRLTDQVYSVEVVQVLHERARAVLDALSGRGYEPYRAIQLKHGDGYFGWSDADSFDKIIVMCGIDHIPPSLLRQLRPDGVMLVPIGPPGAQQILRIRKTIDEDGETTVSRTSLLGGRTFRFMTLVTGK
jgi:protein-L-isoaspartate(D-aspartate) O-methyltransferase